MPVEFSGGNSGTIFIPELLADPVSPPAESAWVLFSTFPPTGTPIGLLLSLTYAVHNNFYQFSYQTIEGPIVRTTLAVFP